MIISRPNDLIKIVSGLDLRSKLPLTIGLIGVLGAGKTTLVKYLLMDLGIPESEVTSPTYTLQNIYHNDNLQIEHWDLYRLKHLPEELIEPVSENTLRVIEWIDLVPNYRELIDLEIKIEIIESYQREITIIVNPKMDFR